MRRKILFLFLLLFSLTTWAENDIVVDTMYLAQTDMTARTEGTRLPDDVNGGYCALIKVQTTQHGFVFDVGSVGFRKKEDQNGEHPAEIWLYVPAGIRKMSIQHAQLGVLQDYRIPVAIKAGNTYIMRLSTGKVHTIVEHKMEEKYLAFDLTPVGAIVEVEGVDWPVGESACRVKMGIYKYHVFAPDYHDEAGIVRVEDDGNTKTRVTVKLKPAFGWINFTGEQYAEGAKIYLDDRYIGVVPMKTGNIPSGAHTVKIVKNMYNALERKVLVTDEETVTVKADLNANFATITLKTVAGAEIWVDDEKKGVGSWTGSLTAGVYVMETRAPHHRNNSVKKQIALVQNGQTIELPAPYPIYGSLDVRSTPMGANILLDGKKIDDTPALIGKILEGEHTLEVTKEGYSSYKQSISIRENETTSVACTLESGRKVTFTVNVPATIYIDNKGPLVATANSAGKSYETLLSYGKHDIEVTKPGYIPLHKSIVVDDKTFTIPIGLTSSDNLKLYAGEGVSDISCYDNGNAFVVDYTLTRNNAQVSLVGVPSRANVSGEINRKLSAGKHRFYLNNTGTSCSATIDASSKYQRYSNSMLNDKETSLLFSLGQSLQMRDMRNYGLMFMQLYGGHGWYLKARSNFTAAPKGVTYNVESYNGGLTIHEDYKGQTLFPTGNVKYATHTFSVGYALDFLRVSYHAPKNRFNKLGLYTGLGYGYSARYLEIYDSLGGTTWTKESANSGHVPNGGLTFDLGLFFSVGGLTISAGYSTINFVSDHFMEFGLGWTF